jgi:ribonuclease HI
MRWKVNTDGGCRSNPGPGSWGFVIKANDIVIQAGSGFLPNCTNNIAEYRAFEAACITILNKEPKDLPKGIEFFSDSMLLVQQINKNWKVNEPILPYFLTAQAAFMKLQGVLPSTISWFRRDFNGEADALCNMEMDKRGIVCIKKKRAA